MWIDDPRNQKGKQNDSFVSYLTVAVLCNLFDTFRVRIDARERLVEFDDEGFVAVFDTNAKSPRVGVDDGECLVADDPREAPEVGRTEVSVPRREEAKDGRLVEKHESDG